MQISIERSSRLMAKSLDRVIYVTMNSSKHVFSPLHIFKRLNQRGGEQVRNYEKPPCERAGFLKFDKYTVSNNSIKGQRRLICTCAVRMQSMTFSLAQPEERSCSNSKKKTSTTTCSIGHYENIPIYFDPLNFYIVKLGFTRVYIIFLISTHIYSLWVLV